MFRSLLKYDDWRDEARDILVVCAGTLATALIMAALGTSLSRLKKVHGL